MKLQLKLAIYNALSKAVIVLAFGAFLPMLVERVVYDHIDQRLHARKDKLFKIIERGGLNDIVRESDCTFESYNILKEEFIVINPLKNENDIRDTSGVNEEWSIEGENLIHRIIRQSFIYDNQLYELTIGEGISTIDQLKDGIAKFSLWATVLIVLISVFFDIGFVRIMLRPFNKIVEQKLKNPRDLVNFDYTPVKSTTSEFQYLDKSVNEMMKRVKDTFLMEKEFITNISHELQTPISILKSRFENMLADENVPDEIAVKIDESIRTLNRVSKVIRTLLLISRIENAQYLKDENVDIKELVSEVYEDIREKIAAKNIRFATNFIENHVIQPANKSLLYTLILNLVGNAVKYNKEGGSITITGVNNHNGFTLEISDTGKGISKENVPHIFDRFKKYNQSEEPSYGLGLTIVKTIADFHRIKIRLKSEENIGTTFYLDFP